MNLGIDKKLRELRQKQGTTQEALANHLSISMQAVSKWERGDGMPDITLLPGIAAFYNTTVDALLGCDEIRKQEEITEFKKQYELYSYKGDIESRLSVCREMQKKYPHDETVLEKLMRALFFTDPVGNAEEIIQIGERILSNGSSIYRYSALQMLCRTYSKLGNDELAVKYAKMTDCNTDLLVHALKGEELVKHCQTYFYMLSDKVMTHVQYLTEEPASEYTPEQRHAVWQFLCDLTALVFADGDFGFWHNRLARAYLEMAVCSAESGEHMRALEELESMLNHCSEYEKFDAAGSIDHTSTLVNKMHYETTQSARTEMRNIYAMCLSMIENSSRLDPLRSESRFISVLEMLKARSDTKN